MLQQSWDRIQVWRTAVLIHSIVESRDNIRLLCRATHSTSYSPMELCNGMEASVAGQQGHQKLLFP
jgi:hypothetical protein